MSGAALWLNRIFASFDYAIGSAVHGFAESTHGFFTPFMNFVSFFGKGGVAILIAAFLLLLFRKTRKTGVCIIAAFILGVIVTNLILKNLIARPRPYSDAGSAFYEWWRFAGSVEEGEFSFPSGHTTAITAALTAVFFTCPKKYSWCGYIFCILMGISRIYLGVHYASDVLGGLIAGFAAGWLAFVFIEKLYALYVEGVDSSFARFTADADFGEYLNKKIFKRKTENSDS